MRRSALMILVTMGVALAVFAQPAAAFKESETEPWGANTSIPAASCSASYCHGVPFGFSGPHGLYTNTTDKCAACHDVHESQSSSKLLVADTIVGVCHSCHDLSFTSTGGIGVYGALRGRGVPLGARHNVEGYNETEAAYVATQAIPGGNTVLDDDGNPRDLICTSCHTPHGYTTMAAFRGDRWRNPAGSVYAPRNTQKLLKDNVNNTARGSYTEYGTLWCGACHTRRHSLASGVNNHPTNNTPTFGYEDVTHTAGTGMWALPSGTNAGYTMFPVAANPDGRVLNRQGPLCQQCHEDYRDVEAAFDIGDRFGVGNGSVGDGATQTVSGLFDNPRFQTFPHETEANNMTVETGDDLCLNCHATSALP